MTVLHRVGEEHEHQGLNESLSHEHQHCADDNQHQGNLRHEEQEIARQHQHRCHGVELAAIHFRGDTGIDRQRTQLRNTHHRHKHHIEALVAENVFHIVEGEADSGGIAHHEKAHGESRPHELVVLHEGVPHLTQGGGLLRLGCSAPLLHTQEGEEKSEKEDDGDDEGAAKPHLGGIPQRTGHRLPRHHDDVHTDVGADTGECARLFPLLLVGGHGGQQRPVADVVDTVGNVPQEIGKAEGNDKDPARTDVGKEEDKEHSA